MRQTSKPEDAITISLGSNLSMGPFARLAQSARLLSQTLRNVSDVTSDPNQLEEEAAQLRHTLLALINLYHIEQSMRQLELCTQSAVCYRYIPFSLSYLTSR